MTIFLIIAAALIVLFLPGTTWHLLTRPRGLDPVERIAEAAGASLALTGLIALYLFLAGIRLSAASVVGIYLAVLGAGTAAGLLRRMRFRLSAGLLLGAGAALGLIAWRLYQARDLVLPAWVDPVHHVLLVRKIVEYGGVPPDWQPYLPAPMFYHFGFHILAAAFSFWSGQSPDQAVLIFGQVMNAMTAFSVYRLARAAWGSPLRAGLAGLLTAFAFHMPAYYLSWGRYPLLAGLLVLPLAMAAALEVRRDPKDRSAWSRLALYSAATGFCHFLAVGLLGLFFLALLGAELWRGLREHGWKTIRWQPFAGTVLGTLAVSPWLWRVWTYSSQYFSVEVPTPSLADADGLWQYLGFLTGPWRSHLLLGLAGLGLVFALIQGRARLLAVWGLMLAFLSTPYGPRFDPFRPDHLAIVLFLPGSLLLAELIASLGEELGRWNWRALPRFLRLPRINVPAMDYPPFPIPYRPAAARHTHMPLRAPEAGDGGAGSASEGGEEGIRSKTEAGAGEVRVDRESIERQVFSAGLPILVGIGLALWGMWETRSIVNPVTVLANSADLAAIHWVEDKTPAEARFFINSTPWMGEVYRGVDGGYWLLPLAGRFAIVPPLAAGWGERQDATRLNQWAKRASEVSDCDERFWSLVGDSRLDYAYLRQGEGSLTPAILDRCDGARRVYSQGGVYIYTLSSK